MNVCKARPRMAHTAPPMAWYIMTGWLTQSSTTDVKAELRRERRATVIPDPSAWSVPKMRMHPPIRARAIMTTGTSKKPSSRAEDTPGMGDKISIPKVTAPAPPRTRSPSQKKQEHNAPAARPAAADTTKGTDSAAEPQLAR
ncbi:hypothetical protein BJ684DRAFT_16452 [Piptocephalis cylindrospora]|uniref:Uncharacterized protein n=1 Tax=Piptocephalis cylindrospora TaxID=1907219 RepID=A0A4P9Y363_9FUNG|nr:hypothetical protein BJ684DRAFT_16452 [Piptocephalis cylindrospora]|eukprot:RKP13114.1 hypothetical protein BJ684DRAFT_16452 [Piptocephalis cylindrospora]